MYNMINLLIIVNSVDKNIFGLCFNIKKKIKSNIIIYEKTGFLKKLVKQKYSNNNFEFTYYDKIIEKLPNDFNIFNIIIKNTVYDYNDLFSKLKLDKINQIKLIKRDKVIYNDDEIDYKNYFIDDELNIKSEIHNKIKIKKLQFDKNNNFNINFILYGFTRCNKKINIKTKLRNLKGIQNVNLYYNFPNFLNEPIDDNTILEEDFFIGMNFDKITTKKFDYNKKLEYYINELKSDIFLKKYIDNLNLRFKVRFIRIYSMLSSIGMSINLIDNIEKFSDEDYFIITRYDILKSNPHILFINNSNNYIFNFRDKFHPSIEDRLIILNKNCILKLRNFYNNFNNNFINLIKNEEILANNGILSGEYFFRHIFLKSSYMYIRNNYNIDKVRVNKKKNSKLVFNYYKKLWNQ